MGVNSVPSTLSPCSTHCLPSCQLTKVCVCIPPLLYVYALVALHGVVCALRLFSQ